MLMDWRIDQHVTNDSYTISACHTHNIHAFMTDHSAMIQTDQIKHKEAQLGSSRTNLTFSARKIQNRRCLCFCSNMPSVYLLCIQTMLRHLAMSVVTRDMSSCKSHATLFSVTVWCVRSIPPSLPCIICRLFSQQTQPGSHPVNTQHCQVWLIEPNHTIVDTKVFWDAKARCYLELGQSFQEWLHDILVLFCIQHCFDFSRKCDRDWFVPLLHAQWCCLAVL